MSIASFILYLLLSGTHAAAVPLIKRKGGSSGGARGGSFSATSSGGSVSSGSLTSEQWKVVKVIFIVIAVLCAAIVIAYIGYKLYLKYVRRREAKWRSSWQYPQKEHYVSNTNWVYVVTIDHRKPVIRFPERTYRR
ncbi:hypothetical protein BDD12DRAFT_822006 [Trichophaea hybrida]|nr:hypothetical protein BDD12DRAFT_822006 [Trichophaea hybrida]